MIGVFLLEIVALSVLVIGFISYCFYLLVERCINKFQNKKKSNFIAIYKAESELYVDPYLPANYTAHNNKLWN